MRELTALLLMIVCDGTPLVADYVSLATAAGKDASCSAADRSIWKAPKPAGATCKRSIDCAPVCCTCPTAGRSALTSWCRDGVCAEPAKACCALLGTPTLSCGNKTP